MLPIVNPNRNRNINYRRIPVDLARAGIIWGQLLLPREEFDRLMRTVIGASAAGASYVTYKAISTVGRYMPNFIETVNHLNRGTIKDDQQPKNRQEYRKKLQDATIEEVDINIDGDIKNVNKKRERQSFITDSFQKKKFRSDGTPLINLQQSSQVQTLTMPDLGSGNKAGLTETPIDKVVDVERGVSSYQFASLPWNATWYDNVTGMNNLDIGFRMTSPYDVVIATQTTDTNPSASAQREKTLKADADDTVVNKAMWFDFYANIYKYYHVVSCKWKLLFENMGNEPVWIHHGYIAGTTLPPTGASNMDMMNWSGVTSQFVPPLGKFADSEGLKNPQLVAGFQSETDTAVSTEIDPNTSWPLTHKGSNILQLSGQYSPGDADRDIKLDADVENWTLTSTNPKLPERLWIRLRPETERYRGTQDINIPAGRRIHYKYIVELEYLVEFKELKDGLKWPVSRQPLTITINQDKTESGMTDE